MTAEWTLFILGTLHKLHEFFVVLVHSVRNLVLLASLAFVQGHLAIETVVLFTLGTLKVLHILLFEHECEVAICRGTPRHVYLVFNCLIEEEGLLFFIVFFAQNVL